MNKHKVLTEKVADGALDTELTTLYGSAQCEMQRHRWLKLLQEVAPHLSERQCTLFRAPGRSEIGGNHTDHNHGKVLVGTIDVDIIAVVSPRTDRRIMIHNCDDQSLVEIETSQLEPRAREQGTSAALVRGVTAALETAGVTISGFEAFTSATLPLGQGLSSSAAFEALIGVILQRFGDHHIPLIELAKAGQYAENRYFGKPCGLEDQIGALSGGLTTIDFEDFEAIRLQRLEINFNDWDLQLAVVDSHSSHASLTPHYAAIPTEMHTIAQHFGHKTLRPLTEAQLLREIPALRRYGDRAILRALHYFRENMRVQEQIKALQEKNIARFLSLVCQSGFSSWMLLQNCIVPGESQQQGMALALAATEDFIHQRTLTTQAACRVHGGGFAGAIQVYLPRGVVEEYRSYIETMIAPQVFLPIMLSPRGAGELRL